MKRYLAKLIFRIRMARFPKPPKHIRDSNGRFVSRKDWRLQQLRGQG